MSHFTLLVKIPDEKVKGVGVSDALKTALAPYQENNCGDCPREFLEFNDEHDEYVKEWESGSCEMVVLDDGTMAYPWDKRFQVPGTFGIGRGTHEPPCHLERRNVPHKERFASLEEFAREWQGSRGLDPEMGRYGHWENPNRKWDWYTIGGRWDGMLRSKLLQGGHDVVQFRDLDLGKMDDEVEGKVSKFYYSLLGHSKKGDGHDWEDVMWIAPDLDLIQRYPPKKGQMYGDFLRMESGFPLLKPIPEFRDFLSTHRHYWEFHTRAVLDEGGTWHEKGQMGWFGCSSETLDESTAWNKSFRENHLTDVDPDTYIVVVDCHI